MLGVVVTLGAVLSVGLLTLESLAQAQDVASIFQVAKTPNPQRIYSNDLFAVSASSPTDIWAVGLAAIHFNGKTWTGYPLPGINGDIGSELRGVAAISPTNAWAVGSFKTSDISTGNLQHWDGSAWSVSPPPSGTQGEILQSITAISASDMWAGGCIPAFLERFDGTQWTYFALQDLSAVNESCITGISAISPSDIWAVGWNSPNGGSNVTVTEHWNGTSWTFISSPNVGTGDNQLNGVVALADDNVWAAGFSTAAPNGAAANQTLIEHWDGTTWIVVPSPNVAYGGLVRDNLLQGIVAVSPNDLWAFGYYEANPSGESGDIFSLAMRWNGTNWSVASTPDPTEESMINDPLYAGILTGPKSLWLVGAQELDLAKHTPASGTLVLHTTGD
jgi:hypothetical protein